jgi:hypothetical protein
VVAFEKALASDSEHPWARAIRDERLIGQIMQFCEDPVQLFAQPAEHMKELRAVMAQFRLCFTAERRIEGLHAKSQKGVKVAPHHSMPYISMAHRQKQIRAELQQEPTRLDELAKAVMLVSSGRLAVHHLGLAAHPACRDARCGRDTIYAQVVYHADAFTKYLAAPPSLDMNNPEFRPDPLVAHRGDDTMSLKHKIAVDDVLQHFGQGGQGSVFYSMPLVKGALRTLLSVLRPLPHGARNGFSL